MSIVDRGELHHVCFFRQIGSLIVLSLASYFFALISVDLLRLAVD